MKVDLEHPIEMSKVLDIPQAEKQLELILTAEGFDSPELSALNNPAVRRAAVHVANKYREVAGVIITNYEAITTSPVFEQEFTSGEIPNNI